MDYDEIYKHFDGKQKWQIINTLIFWLPATVGGMFVLVYTFTGKNRVNLWHK